MPPALAKDLEYSSDRKERHTPAPAPPPKGPSPPIAVNMWFTMLLRNTASKSCAAARALAAATAFGSTPALESSKLALGEIEGVERTAAITSPRCRPGSRRRL